LAAPAKRLLKNCAQLPLKKRFQFAKHGRESRLDGIAKIADFSPISSLQF